MPTRGVGRAELVEVCRGVGVGLGVANETMCTALSRGERGRSSPPKM